MPDTTQRVCYNNNAAISCPAMTSCATTPFCGQDGQYGWAPSHPAEARFTRDTSVTAHPIVIDNVTHLIWQGCRAGLASSDCSSGTIEARTWTGAIAYCDGLVWAGYADWRLPDNFEMMSIVDWDRTSDCLDQGVFPASPRSPYGTWMINKRMTMGPYRLFECVPETDFSGTEPRHVRCVRSLAGPTVPTSRWTRDTSVANEPTVTDAATGLRWQGCVSDEDGANCTQGSPVEYTWEAALSHCEGLVWGGFNDWRMPNIAEQLSLADYTANESTDPVTFPGSFYGHYRTSTTTRDGLSSAYTIASYSISVSDAVKTSEFLTFGVRCVR
jgi:hypothetical protein